MRRSRRGHKVLGLKKNNNEKIKAEALKRREKLLARAQEMRKLTLAPNSGWTEFLSIIDEYVHACMKRKALTALDMATDAEIYQLKLLDHEIYFINSFIKKIPARIFSAEEDLIKKTRKQDDSRKVDKDEEEEE